MTLTSYSAFQYSQLRVRLAGPHQLQPKPDADDLQFGKIFTDHMFKATYHKRLGGWQKPEIMPLENLVIHPAAKVLHYAVEVSFTLKLFHGLLLLQFELLTAHMLTRNSVRHTHDYYVTLCSLCVVVVIKKKKISIVK